jgi:hypothetical protein
VKRPAARGAGAGDLLIGVAIAGLAAALGLWIYGRMASWNEAARRASEEDQRLSAAWRLIARDLRRDGYRLAELGPVTNLPARESGALTLVFVDDTAETRAAAAPAGAGAPPGAIPVEATAGFDAGAWALVGGPGAACAARVKRAVDGGPGARWLELDGRCGWEAGRPVARLGFRRYRVRKSELQYAEGPDGAWRALTPGVERLDVAPAPAPPGGRGRLFHLALASGGEPTRRVEGTVFALQGAP